MEFYVQVGFWVWGGASQRLLLYAHVHKEGLEASVESVNVAVYLI